MRNYGRPKCYGSGGGMDYCSYSQRLATWKKADKLMVTFFWCGLQWDCT